MTVFLHVTWMIKGSLLTVVEYDSYSTFQVVTAGEHKLWIKSSKNTYCFSCKTPILAKDANAWLSDRAARKTETKNINLKDCGALPKRLQKRTKEIGEN